MDTWTQWRSCLVHIELCICWGKKNFFMDLITWLVGPYFSNWWLILCPLQWNHRVLTIGPPGESPKRFLKALFPCIKKLSEYNYFPMWNHVIMLNKLFQMCPIPWRHWYVGHRSQHLSIVVQSLSRVQLFATPSTAAHQASLSLTVS